MEDALYSVAGIYGDLKVFGHLLMADKNVIIDTVPEGIEDEFTQKIEELVGIKNIDYAVFTNASPEHAGALKKLLEINPDIMVIATAAGLRNLKEIVNGDFKQRVAKDGDSIKVYKDYTIDFMITPNLDWPDTMMVRYRDAVYAGKLFQHGTNYDDYFNKHFGHFSDFVLTAMERIEKLGIDRIFTSVGDEPVVYPDFYIKRYRGLINNKPNKVPVILFSSVSGYTEKMTIAIAQTFEEKGIAYEFINSEKEKEADIIKKINNASVLCIGSPTVYRNAVSSVMSCLVKTDAVMSAGKPCMVFGSYGWGGDALGILNGYAKLLKMRVFEKPFGVVLKPSDEDIEKLKAYTRRFIESAV